MNKQVNVKFSVYIMVALEYILKGVFAGEIAFWLILFAAVIICSKY